MDAPASVGIILHGFYWWRQQQEVLSDTGSDQEKGFETADEFNRRLETATELTADEPDATVRLPETSQKKDARVHFDQDQISKCLFSFTE